MKKFIAMVVMAVIFVNSAFAASKTIESDHSFTTRGDMTDEELALVMNMRDRYDDFLLSATNLYIKLGNAILTSSFGLIFDTAAFGSGLFVDIKRAKEDNKFTKELKKLDDAELKTKFETEFKSACEDDKKKNPDKYKETVKCETDEDSDSAQCKKSESEEKEDKKAEVKEITCDDMLKKFAGGEDKEVTRQAMTAWLANKNAGGETFDKTLNWMRMGAGVVGMGTNIASIAIIDSAAKDIDDILTKQKAFIAARDSVNKAWNVARLEGRTENPMEKMGACSSGKLSFEQIQKNLNKAKAAPIIGAVSSGLGAAAAGANNSKAGANSKTNKGLSIGSTTASGVGAVASGVAIGVVVSNQKQVDENINSIMPCEEWLWWDKHNHPFKTPVVKPVQITTQNEYIQFCKKFSGANECYSATAVYGKNGNPLFSVPGKNMSDNGLGWSSYEEAKMVAGSATATKDIQCDDVKQHCIITYNDGTKSEVYIAQSIYNNTWYNLYPAFDDPLYGQKRICSWYERGKVCQPAGAIALDGPKYIFIH
ncbi:MAG: hypothetical protein FWE50_01945 [Alphaproteobacteria bacterium]|nr:hypothetical protein [Alphaproteobacteria bacterium]